MAEFEPEKMINKVRLCLEIAFAGYHRIYKVYTRYLNSSLPGPSRKARRLAWLYSRGATWQDAHTKGACITKSSSDEF